MKARIGTAVAFVALAACGGGASGSNGPAGSREAYPSGPFGTTQGSVLANLAFVGPDGSPRTLADLHKDEKNKVLLVSTSAGWCMACLEEQPVLAQWHGELGTQGLVVMVALFEDRQFQPADAAYVEDWKRRYSLPFDVVADPQFQLGGYYNKEATPMNMIVDLSSMEIRSIGVGFDVSDLRARIEALL